MKGRAMKPEYVIQPLQRGLRRRWALPVLVIAACIAAYGLGAWLALPYLVERALARYESSVPGRTASVGRIGVEPFVLGVELTDLRLLDPDAALTVRVPRLRARLSPRSLLARRWVLERLEFDTPSIQFGLAAAGEAFRAAFDSAEIGRLQIDAGTVAIVAPDRPAQQHAVLRNVVLRINGLDIRSESAGRFTLAAESAGGASLAADGELTGGFGGASGRLAASGLALEELGAWLGASLAGLSPRGRLAVNGNYVLDAPLGRAQLGIFEGRWEIDDFGIVPRPDLAVGSPSVVVAGEAKFLFDEDGAGAQSSFELALDDGRFELVDARVSPPVSFDFQEVAGRLFSEPGVELRARLAGAGDASIAASPQRLSVKLQAVPAARLSAYAASLFERGLEAGHVDFGLDYARAGERIEGTLRLGADSLVLAAGGSDSAPASALSMAAALLEDSNGAIRLTVPFAAGAAADVYASVTAALRNRIDTLAASPFDVLGLVAGRSGPSLRHLGFQPGIAALSESASDALAALAEVLRSRPRLNVGIHGNFDPSLDRDALAAQQVELHVLLATAGPAFRARPERVDFASPRARDILDEFAGERLAPGRLAALASRFSAASGPEASPGQRDAYYRALFEALAAEEPIEPASLQRLARFRAQSVLDALAAQGLAPERMALNAGNAPEPSAGVSFALQPADRQP
jgi:outer membrane protein OmpA-like peptidoglycan-associated protein